MSQTVKMLGRKGVNMNIKWSPIGAMVRVKDTPEARTWAVPGATGTVTGTREDFPDTWLVDLDVKMMARPSCEDKGLHKSHFEVVGPVIGTATDGRPVIRAIAKGRFKQYGRNDERVEDGCHLTFTCPKCKTKISHGGWYGQPGMGDGRRVAHCKCWPRGYYVKEIEEA